MNKASKWSTNIIIILTIIIFFFIFIFTSIKSKNASVIINNLVIFCIFTIFISYFIKIK
jgi:hypothetical protein